MLVAQPIPIHTLQHPLLDKMQVEVRVARLDLVHAEVSGNKFFKLKYNLQAALSQNHSQILTFGGAYSNHIYATATAAKTLGLSSIGILRGEFLDPSNPSLQHARASGMHLHGISREAYRQKTSAPFLDQLKNQFGDFYLLPEGGTNQLAIQGTQEILSSIPHTCTHICTPVGSGGTFAGLASSLQPHQHLLGVSALKGEGMNEEVMELLHRFQLTCTGSQELLTQYHHGGYAKWSTELIAFVHWFWEEFKIPLDPVYTGKMAFACWDLLQKNYFPPGSQLVLLHTGGLQGNRGFTQRTGIALPTP